MKKFLAALLSILLFLHLIVIVLPVEAGAASGDDSLALYAQSAVLMDADTGRVLYGKNETEDLPMASTTKIRKNRGIMTLLLISMLLAPSSRVSRVPTTTMTW